MGEVRRAAGILESEYVRRSDGVDRIATIRCLARLLGPPDARYEHIGCCSLVWSVDRNLHITVMPNGAITS
jgi:hypothetical protein